jgi:diguanylate cyclase (GGDEF)-like protein/PAS domain S-box-containing protein
MPTSTDELRRSAEARLQDKATEDAALSLEDTRKLLHELQVHQIELEMQCKALLDADSEKEEALLRYTELFDFAPIGYLILDRISTIRQLNLQGASLLGHERSNLTGRLFVSYLTDEHRVKFNDCLAKAFSTGNKQNCEILIQVDEHNLWLSLEANIGIAATNCLVAMNDITERKIAEEKLKRLANYDLLTNLPNSALLADRLNQSMVQCQLNNRSLAVAYLDLDGFKSINDSYGHSVGDELLITVSHRMKEALREGDTLREGDMLARIGGDEFIAVMVNLDNINDKRPVLERLLKAAADPVSVGDELMQVSASIGVTIYPQDGVNAEQLIRHADQAMYIAKQAGKNRYHRFDTAQDNLIQIQRECIRDVRSASGRHEFVLYYQPKVNMRTGEVIGVEALIRWQHPDRGIVLPLEFLPAIEGRTISLELGEWVIDTALTQISQWQSIGVHLPISVNISAYQLQQGDFTTRLTALLTAHPEVNPQSLELEVLETSALNDINQVSNTMNACQDLGVNFALDDFGTGYSSLTYLRRLPAHLIKIDQSFVRDMLEDADDLAIVVGVVNLAKAFQSEVIAEGVETVEHGLSLLQLGCELAQGYSIARPMPADDIPEWAANWKADDSWLVKSPIE